MRLSRDVQTCEDLLNGLPVDMARLDPDGLTWALMMRFVRLDTTAIELFFSEGEASVLEGARYAA